MHQTQPFSIFWEIWHGVDQTTVAMQRFNGNSWTEERRISRQNPIRRFCQKVNFTHLQKVHQVHIKPLLKWQILDWWRSFKITSKKMLDILTSDLIYFLKIWFNNIYHSILHVLNKSQNISKVIILIFNNDTHYLKIVLLLVWCLVIKTF